MEVNETDSSNFIKGVLEEGPSISHYGVKGMKWGEKKDDEFLTDKDKADLASIKDPAVRKQMQAHLIEKRKKDAARPAIVKGIEKAGQDFSNFLRDRGILTTRSTTTDTRRVNGVKSTSVTVTETSKGKTKVIKPKPKAKSGTTTTKRNKDGSITTTTKNKDGSTSSNTQRVKSITGADGTKYDPKTKKPLKPKSKSKITSITGADGTKYDPKTKKKLKHSDEDDFFIAHYGVLGMKWGVRKDRGRRVNTFGADSKVGDYSKGPRGSKVTVESVRKVEGGNELILRHKPPRGSKKNAAPTARRFSDLSDEELKARIMRIENEQKLARLLTPPPRAGKEFVKGVVTTAGKQVLTTAAVSLGTYALNNAAKKLKK